MKYGNSFKLTLIYLIAGLAWVYLGDLVVNVIFDSGTQQSAYQTLKGFIYIFFTALLLFFLLRRFYKAQFIKLNELKNKERYLRESESRYQLLFEESPLAKIIYDKENLNILELNNQALKNLGYSREDIVGRPVTDLLSHLKLGYPRIDQQHDITKGIHTYQRTDGSLIKVEIASHPFQFRNISCVLLVCLDVTEREEALEQLKDNQRKLLSAQRIANIGYWQIYLSSGEMYWSDEIYEIWGLNKDGFKLEYEAFYNTIHPDDRHLFPSPGMEQSNEEIKYDIEHRIVLPDGSIKWVHERSNLIYDDDGNPLFLEGTVQDVTSQKLLSLSLEESLQRYDYVTKATSDAIWDWDLVNNTIVWGNGFYKLFGYTKENTSLSISSWTDHIAEDDKERVLASIMQVIQGNETYWKDEYRYRTADGSHLFVVDKGFVIRDEQNKAIRMVGAMRDITEKKKEAIQKELIAEISRVFNTEINLSDALTKTLIALVKIGQFDLAEAWIVGREKKKINLVARFAKQSIQNTFYSKRESIKAFEKGAGLPGICWEKGTLQYWNDVVKDGRFLRTEEAKAAGIKSAYGLPLRYNNEVLGVLLLGTQNENLDSKIFSTLFDNLYSHLGSEIRRKQVEEELNQLFLFAPDIVCIANTDGFFKKINPAMTALLGYTEEELLSQPCMSFIHPDDANNTIAQLNNQRKGLATPYFENRYITKTGKIKWLAWTASAPSEEGLLFSVGKDITDKKELTLLLDKATSLATIGAWEIDLVADEIHWSVMTKKIHEVADDFIPTKDNTILFFEEGKYRDEMVQKVTDSIVHGTAWDIETQIITATGKTKWIRVIGEAEFADGRCIRIYGSFQDIDRVKKSELALVEALNEKQAILESIGEAFFALDKHGTITYWNNMAEKLLERKREEVIGTNLSNVFTDALNTPFYTNSEHALKTREATYFEVFYDGTKTWFEVGVYPSPTGLSVFFKDVTDRHNYIATIEQHNETLKEIAWSQSHEVRAPLVRILGVIQLIKDIDMTVPEELQKMLDMMEISAKDLDDIIRSINEKTKLN